MQALLLSPCTSGMSDFVGRSRIEDDPPPSGPQPSSKAKPGSLVLLRAALPYKGLSGRQEKSLVGLQRGL